MEQHLKKTVKKILKSLVSFMSKTHISTAFGWVEKKNYHIFLKLIF